MHCRHVCCFQEPMTVSCPLEDVLLNTHANIKKRHVEMCELSEVYTIWNVRKGALSCYYSLAKIMCQNERVNINLAPEAVLLSPQRAFRPIRIREFRIRRHVKTRNIMDLKRYSLKERLDPRCWKGIGVFPYLPGCPHAHRELWITEQRHGQSET